MGCAQSKIENEETVTRCKERKRFMKEAVGERNAFAAAHSAYAMSLKNTGAALSDYAQGEVQFSPSVSASVASSSAAVPGTSSALPQTSYDSLPPPPPPFLPPPLQRSSTAPEMSFMKPDIKHSDTILEDENEEENDVESVHELRHRNTKSSGGGVGGGGGGLYRQGPVEAEVLQPPPSPPRTPPLNHRATPPPPPPPESKGMAYWDFFASMDNVPGPTLSEVDVNNLQRVEIERKMMEERAKRSEIDSVGGRKSTGKAETNEVVEKEAELPPQSPQAPAVTKVVRVRQVAPVEGKKKGPNMNLLQIFTELDDCFLKAYQSTNEVSKMLEANRLHYHSNFADNRGHIDHSARVMRVITWNRSFRGLQTPDDANDDFDSEENETHATVLDKMLAWEKKLYDEVKAGEQMKLEYQKKVASLNKLKKRGSNTEALERMKAAVSHLHTRYIVDMQSMDSTVSEINRLRDEQLYPKLVELVDGMATMWENMSVHHQNQFKIVHALRSLDISQCSKETSEHHHGRTYQLHEVIKEWHSQCEKLMSHQKKYVAALNNWLKLNLIPIDTNLREKVSSPQRPQSPAIQPLLHAWQDYLEKLPDELARTAIYNFSAVINTIMQYQMDEIKMKDRCEETRKELMRKTRQFEDWYHKYMQRKTPTDDMDPDKELEKQHIAERELQVEIIKKRLEEEEEAYQKQCLQVREKSLTSLRQRLPELFRAMSDFSLACSDMYGHLRSMSQMHNTSETA